MSTYGFLTFTLTDAHLTLLGAAYVGWDDGEYGAPAIDCKRPYGNSDVTADILELLWPERYAQLPELEDDDIKPPQEWEDEARRVHEETQTALQIVLSTRSFVPGSYRTTKRYDRTSWVLDA